MFFQGYSDLRENTRRPFESIDVWAIYFAVVKKLLTIAVLYIYAAGKRTDYHHLNRYKPWGFST